MKLDGVPEHKRNTAAETPAPIIDRSASIKGLLTTFDNSRGPLSIRLNAAYETGKTTFLDQLQKTADKDKFIIIYYNAWEEEISLDARSSLCLKLLSEIQNLNTEENFQSSILKYQKAILPFIASAGTAVISRVIFRDHEALENIINAVKPEQEIRKLMDEKFAELQQNSSTIDAVKSSLKSLLDILSGKKIILLIDELDRCRPDFAMEVLETVKHFFSIEKVFALVGVDENILHSIIKKRYGDTIDCEGYLLRHFSSEMQFSEFSYQQYCMD
ncbi:MAG: P-loop NTPase fold protein, partial [Hyphomicrobiales bacterium]